MPGPLVQTLIAHVENVFAGPNGDYPATLEALQGVTAATALWKPAPGQNSIWQIVDHLAGSTEWQIEVLKSGKATPPEWTEPSGDERDWQAAVARLKDVHARLRTAVEQLTDEDLLRVPVPEWNQTLLALVLSSGPSHEAHHGGQIDYIKGLHPH